MKRRPRLILSADEDIDRPAEKKNAASGSHQRELELL